MYVSSTDGLKLCVKVSL